MRYVLRSLPGHNGFRYKAKVLQVGIFTMVQNHP